MQSAGRISVDKLPKKLDNQVVFINLWHYDPAVKPCVTVFTSADCKMKSDSFCVKKEDHEWHGHDKKQLTRTLGKTKSFMLPADTELNLFAKSGFREQFQSEVGAFEEDGTARCFAIDKEHKATSLQIKRSGEDVAEDEQPEEQTETTSDEVP